MNILKKRADWAQDIHDPRAAAEMYLNAGETLKAVEIIAANGWTSMQVQKWKFFKYWKRFKNDFFTGW